LDLVSDVWEAAQGYAFLLGIFLVIYGFKTW